MKKPIITIIIIFSFLSGLKAGDLKTIAVSVFKSTFIYFTDPVVSTDLGMNDAYDVLFEKNYVKVTAIKQKPGYQTNLTVTTETGIYAFLLDYQDQPEKLYFFPEDYSPLRVLGKPSNIQNHNTKSSGNIDIEQSCKELFEMVMEYPIVGFSKADVNFYMDKVYVRDNKFYLKFYLKNESNIDYDIDFVKFHIKNKKQIKRSSQQEIYLEPLYTFHEVKKLKANSSESIVFVLDKFTIMNDKQFFVEFEEKKGERNVSFQVMNKDIFQAQNF